MCKRNITGKYVKAAVIVKYLKKITNAEYKELKFMTL